MYHITYLVNKTKYIYIQLNNIKLASEDSHLASNTEAIEPV